MMAVESERRSFDWAFLVPFLVHPLKVAIIEALSWIGEPLSATDLSKVLGGQFSSKTIGRHLASLAEAGAIAEVRQRQVRGSIEKFYFFSEALAGAEFEPTAFEVDFAGIDPALRVALDHPVRRQILRILSEAVGPLTPREINSALPGKGWHLVPHHLGILRAVQCVVPVVQTKTEQPQYVATIKDDRQVQSFLQHKGGRGT